MEYETILHKKNGRISYVTLNRPSVLNAFNEQLGKDLVKVFRSMEDDSEVGVVILTGSGEKAFCAGADIKDTKGIHSFDSLADFLESKHGLVFDVIANFPKPVIAAINGYAIGGGFLLFLCCDIIIASDSARFSVPNVSLGVIPAYAGAIRLARIVGKTRAMEIILTCKEIDAQEAYRIGLVNQLVPLKELMSAAESLAERVAAMPPLTVMLAKESLNKGLDIPLACASNADSYRSFVLYGTEDCKEGHRAARERRKGNFKGR